MGKAEKKSGKSVPRTPVQQRGIRTREKLLAAGKKAFSKHGYHDVVADDIARDAGVAVGSFYAYFSNKRDIFLAILDDYTAQSVEHIDKALQSFPPDGAANVKRAIQKMIKTLVDAHRTSPPLLREFLRMALYDEEIGKRLERIDIRVRRLFEKALVSVGGGKKQQTRNLAYVLYYASEGVIHQMALSTGKIDERGIIRELSRIFACYVEQTFPG